MSWWDDANDWLYDKANDFHQGVKSVKKGIQGVKDDVKKSYDNLYTQFVDKPSQLFDVKPKDESTFDFQKRVAGIPLIGSAYYNYMVGKSQRAYNEQWRNDYGVNYDNTKFPWLSPMWNDKMYQGAGQMIGNLTMAGAGAKVSKNLKKLYEPDLAPKKNPNLHPHGGRVRRSYPRARHRQN